LEQAQRIKEVIVSLLLAQEPIHGSDLVAIIHELDCETNSARAERWTLSSNPFVVVDQKNMVQFIHYSMEEFLQSKNIFEAVDRDVLAHLLKLKLQRTEKASQRVSCKAEFPEIPKEQFAQDKATDLDDTTSITSWPSSVFSTTSSRSSQTSVISQLESVTEQYAELFTDHTTGTLIVEILGAVGGLDLSSYFLAYSFNIQGNCGILGSEQVAALTAGQKTSIIAYQIILRSEYLGHGKVVEKLIAAGEQSVKRQILDRFLGLKDAD
jgi:hypothetical protein